MYFTKEDIQKIKDALLSIGIKDTALQETNIISPQDIITIVQNGKNRRTTVLQLLKQLLEIYSETCINLTDKYGIYIDSLKEAISQIPSRQRKEGLIVTFLDNNKKWKLYQFQGELSQFENTSYWKDIFDVNNYIVNSLLADEEDLTSTEKDINGNSKIKIKNRIYDPSTFSGKGYKLLRKNIIKKVNNDGSINTVNYLSPDEFNISNTIYEIRYDFTLDNKTVDLLENCIIVFNGGSIIDGTLNCNNTLLTGDYSNSSIELTGTYNSISKEINSVKDLISKNTIKINNLSQKTDNQFTSVLNRFTITDNKTTQLEEKDIELDNKYDDLNSSYREVSDDLQKLKTVFYPIQSVESATVSQQSTDQAKIEDLRIVNEDTNPELVALVSNTYCKSFALKNDLDENYKLTNTFTYVSSSAGNVYRVEPFLKGVESNTDTYKLIKLQ